MNVMSHNLCMSCNHGYRYKSTNEFSPNYFLGDVCCSVCTVNRCRLLCCCVPKNNQTANAFEDVAHLISDYFNVSFHYLWLYAQFSDENTAAVAITLHYGCLLLIMINWLLALMFDSFSALVSSQHCAQCFFIIITLHNNYLHISTYLQ